MEIVAYTSVGCFYCTQLHELFKRAELDYKSVVVDSPKQKSEFLAKYPDAIGFPWVIIDGKEYGGLVETTKFLVKNGYVSSKKE